LIFSGEAGTVKNRDKTRLLATAN